VLYCLSICMVIELQILHNTHNDCISIQSKLKDYHHFIIWQVFLNKQRRQVSLNNSSSLQDERYSLWGSLIHCWWEHKLVQPLWKTIWKLLKKLNIDLPYDPSVPFLGIYPRECDSSYNKSTCTPRFIAALFTIARVWKQPKCPITD
jgi:hypothetical protein